MKINGKTIAEEIYRTLRQQVQGLKTQNITPHLAVILVGDDPASHAYVRQKKLRGEEIGMVVTIHQYPQTITTEALVKKIEELNADTSIHGIIIQQPLPSQIDTQSLIQATDPRKDVDGFHADSSFQPPIADAAITILENIYSSSAVEKNDSRLTNVRSNSIDKEFQTWLRSKTITIAGKGETGGKPIINGLKTMGCTVQVIDSKTETPKELLEHADIVLSCIGKPRVLDVTALKKGVILLCIGMFRGEDGKLHGDYEEGDVESIASYYTPVPGGIGPVNVASLLKNVVNAAKKPLIR